MTGKNKSQSARRRSPCSLSGALIGKARAKRPVFRKIAFPLLASIVIAAVIAPIWGQSNLETVHWRHDRENPKIVHLVFGFDSPPDQYPAFFIHKPPALCIHFSRSKISPSLFSRKTVPPPLTDLSITQKEVEQGNYVTRVEIGMEEPVPFLTRKVANSIVVALDISGAIKRSKTVLRQEPIGDHNTLESISVHVTKRGCEILASLSEEPFAFPSYQLSSPPRIVLDLPDVHSSAYGVHPVSVGPVDSVAIVAVKEATRLTFNLNTECEFRTALDRGRISLIIPLEEELKAPSSVKKWIYLTAGALAAGVTGAVLLGGQETPPDVADPSSDWDEPPPDPDGALGD